MSYNFLNLSSTEFEQLCHDLLELQIGYDLEIFAEGKDGGIDLRFESDTELVVIQCKRYSQYNDLLQVLKREVSKVEKLKPTKYILVTSVGLNRTRKDVIKNLFSPFIISTGDIYGKDELNALLRKYPEIEKAHFKLWLSSSAIIEKLIHRQQDTEVSFLLEKIQADQKYLVVPESYKRALEILENDNFVIISGVPGIGKSTMARLLCYNYINKGYQPVIVSRNIEEGYKYFQEGINQVILFEDFLGSNFYKQFLSKNEEQRLIRFIENVANNPKKKLILTTREYIFKQAENECEYIQQADLNVSKCQIDLSECSFMFKSQLLYNRLFFSGISVEYINKLLENDRYLEILDHENFNPRTIETLTTPKKIRRILSSQYVDTFIESLNDPKEIWNHAFEKHISSYAKYILYLLLVADSDMFLEEMGASLESLLIEAGEDTSFFNSKYR
ncbi:restriction endonuclease, partial [Priestia megaterium]|uniref:nSTAND3 domain-containing NTPase n=1 Tax=Priestia megaterium TaxID=1404 RepID=UPI00300BF5C7